MKVCVLLYQDEEPLAVYTNEEVCQETIRLLERSHNKRTDDGAGIPLCWDGNDFSYDEAELDPSIEEVLTHALLIR